MKRRNGFVSNSSSSSFICDVSGGVESGWDLCLSEAYMAECENGHVFYDRYGKFDGEIKEKIISRVTSESYGGYYHEEDALNIIREASILEDLFELDDMRYSLFHECCPICSMHNVSSDDRAAYALKLLDMSKEELTKKIKETFDSYEEFQTAIRGGK
jgi:hypothetical protein